MDAPFPLPLSAYAAAPGASLPEILRQRIEADPFNLVATVIFALAILHTFLAKQITVMAHHAQDRHDARRLSAGLAPSPSIEAGFLHFLGEVEVIFGLWAVMLAASIGWYHGPSVARHYFNDSVNYTEAVFVFVIMALASTQPVLDLAEDVLRRVAALGKCSPVAWWLTLMTVTPLLGSLITEPAAMTIGALLLSKQFYSLKPPLALSYATLGLLFVNISVGGTLTHFAAPPVLMVARPWTWDLPFMFETFGTRAAGGIIIANLVYLGLFHRQFRALRPLDPEPPRTRSPWIITATHVGFMAWTVLNSHYPVVFITGFLFFLGFAKATAAYQTPVDLRSPLLVAFFLAGLVMHGGLQGWWIAPILASLNPTPLFFGALGLTAFNDNALITFLATLVPGLSDAAKHAVVAGAVTGGGLTVIANAPNPAGQAILGRHFEDGVSPLPLFLGALVPTAIVGAAMIFPHP
jgi:hypothetical protein